VADERPLTDAERAAMDKVVAALRPFVDDGPGPTLLDTQEVCIAFEELYEVIGVEHPAVFRMRRALKKLGLNRPFLEGADVDAPKR
jgi:hypothetical protein